MSESSGNDLYSCVRGGSRGGGGVGSGGSVEPPKSKQLTSKACKNVK